jgi:hypothetical protein
MRTFLPGPLQRYDGPRLFSLHADAAQEHRAHLGRRQQGHSRLGCWGSGGVLHVVRRLFVCLVGWLVFRFPTFFVCVCGFFRR